MARKLSERMRLLLWLLAQTNYSLKELLTWDWRFLVFTLPDLPEGLRPSDLRPLEPGIFRSPHTRAYFTPAEVLRAMQSQGYRNRYALSEASPNWGFPRPATFARPVTHLKATFGPSHKFVEYAMRVKGDMNPMEFLDFVAAEAARHKALMCNPKQCPGEPPFPLPRRAGKRAPESPEARFARLIGYWVPYWELVQEATWGDIEALRNHVPPELQGEFQSRLRLYWNSLTVKPAATARIWKAENLGALLYETYGLGACAGYRSKLTQEDVLQVDLDTGAPVPTTPPSPSGDDACAEILAHIGDHNESSN